MHVELREFEACDVERLEMWATCIGADSYMSRHRPLDPALVAHEPGIGLLWYVIRVNGTDVGTVWLELEAKSSVARLGVLLGDESLFGQGIGEEAVNLVLQCAPQLSMSTVVLHVRKSNPRAIACYAKCGFVAVRSGVKRKPDGGEIQYLRMEKRV